MSLWSLREKPPAHLRLPLEVGGLLAMLVLWQGLIVVWGLPKTLLPSPLDVLRAIPALVVGTNVPTTALQRDYAWLPFASHNTILWHALYSLLTNLAAYAVAAIVAVPVGFALGLFGPPRAMAERPLAVFRYLPITAFVGAFVAWFGLGSANIKVAFLAFGLLVYLIPQVVTQIDNVEPIYVDTAKTCGASRWQRIRTVFWPICSARLSDDGRTLVPITWTYIVIAESLNIGQGGLGAIITAAARAVQWDVVFAAVLIIAVMGYWMDKVWLAGDRRAFRWKH